MTDNQERKKRVLVVGAGGFAGGFIVSEGLKRGYEVWAGIRHTTSRRWLDDPAIHIIEFDFENPATLAQSMTDALGEERWDYVIYNLGATKVLSYKDFSRINYDYLRYFTDALKQSDKVPDKLLYISSLSAMGAGDERGYTPFTEEMIPHPNTRYGASKLKAEVLLQSVGIPYIIFRATGIYGPRDHDYFLMFKSISQGVDFSVGFRKQMLTFIYVEDLARAIYDALEKAPTGEIYNIAEGASYSQGEFRRIALLEMGKKFCLPIRVPVWGLKAVSAIAEKWGVIRLKPSTLNRDKYHIMKQRNWNVDISKAQRDFGFKPEVTLEEGVKRSIEWYRREGWMK